MDEHFAPEVTLEFCKEVKFMRWVSLHILWFVQELASRTDERTARFIIPTWCSSWVFYSLLTIPVCILSPYECPNDIIDDKRMTHREQTGADGTRKLARHSDQERREHSHAFAIQDGDWSCQGHVCIPMIFEILSSSNHSTSSSAVSSFTPRRSSIVISKLTTCLSTICGTPKWPTLASPPSIPQPHDAASWWVTRCIRRVYVAYIYYSIVQFVDVVSISPYF